MIERELTVEVPLTVDGRLNPEAVGWARRPLVDTSGLTRGPGRSWGRTKRWEYWNVITPTHILALTVSSIDYAAVHEVFVLERVTGRTFSKAATVIPARDVVIPDNFGSGLARGLAKNLEVVVEPLSDGTRLRASIPQVSFDVTVTRPEDHDCLAVVVPWSTTRFQYTVKDLALPAAGTVTIDGVTTDVPAGTSWAVLDHGRGRWPYDASWNWGAGSGTWGGHTIGLQVGGKWTVGTGSTENGIIVDGHLYKVHDEMTWVYDLADWRRSWHVSGGGLEATLTPFHLRSARTNLGIVAARTDQCFGKWSGSFVTPRGATITFEGLDGWAEDVHNRW
jgi:hypothetical protein